MSAPKRIQRKRTKGWKMPEGAVYVGRPTKWGNPISLLEFNPEKASFVLRDRDEVDVGVRSINRAMQTCCWKSRIRKATEMDGAVVRQRLVARRVQWGFDALGMFFPFPDKAGAEKAAATWSEDLCRREGGFGIASCPLAPEAGEGSGAPPCG